MITETTKNLKWCVDNVYYKGYLLAEYNLSVLYNNCVDKSSKLYDIICLIQEDSDCNTIYSKYFLKNNISNLQHNINDIVPFTMKLLEKITKKELTIEECLNKLFTNVNIEQAYELFLDCIIKPFANIIYNVLLNITKEEDNNIQICMQIINKVKKGVLKFCNESKYNIVDNDNKQQYNMLVNNVYDVFQEIIDDINNGKMTFMSEEDSERIYQIIVHFIDALKTYDINNIQYSLSIFKLVTLYHHINLKNRYQQIEETTYEIIKLIQDTLNSDNN